MSTRLHYFKRYRMEIDLANTPIPVAELPEGYDWNEWDEADVERHALTKHRSFRDEMDAEVFPSLGEYFGCVRLMHEISQQDSFLGPATWLIVCRNQHGIPEDCGTIQGLGPSPINGAIQNVGVVPEHRGLGLGRALVLKSLEGFALARRQRIVLEVTATNQPAVDLYRSIGFRVVRTMYRTAIFEERLA
jgi:ribosomal protein S18 acetylase RimI-like enzyme